MGAALCLLQMIYIRDNRKESLRISVVEFRALVL